MKWSPVKNHSGDHSFSLLPSHNLNTNDLHIFTFPFAQELDLLKNSQVCRKSACVKRSLSIRICEVYRIWVPTLKTSQQLNHRDLQTGHVFILLKEAVMSLLCLINKTRQGAEEREREGEKLKCLLQFCR